MSFLTSLFLCFFLRFLFWCLRQILAKKKPSPSDLDGGRAPRSRCSETFVSRALLILTNDFFGESIWRFVIMFWLFNQLSLRWFVNQLLLFYSLTWLYSYLMCLLFSILSTSFFPTYCHQTRKTEETPRRPRRSGSASRTSAARKSSVSRKSSALRFPTPSSNGFCSNSNFVLTHF